MDFTKLTFWENETYAVRGKIGDDGYVLVVELHRLNLYGRPAGVDANGNTMWSSAPFWDIIFNVPEKLRAKIAYELTVEAAKDKLVFNTPAGGGA